MSQLEKRSLWKRARNKADRTFRGWQDDQRIRRLARQVAQKAPAAASERPIVIFNASTRISENSYNAAYALLTAWAIRLAGVPVIQFVCGRGMARCVLGTDINQPGAPMPCSQCLRRSRINFTGADVRYFGYTPDDRFTKELETLPLEALMQTRRALNGLEIPLGALCLPALRWRLRVHHLKDDEETRQLYREFILSAWNIAREFSQLLDQSHPQAVLVFNGQFFPEATARWLAQQRGIKCITHEVGLMADSAFFTEGEATIYPIEIPETFELNDEQNAKLDAYLEKRFQGNFSMAGIQFWREIKGLDDVFIKKIESFKQIVPVFTNVIFDTSQPHANIVFTDMFAWLDTVLEIAKKHPETLFIIRAHPDETRPGKESRETVAGWVAERGAAALPNVAFIPSNEYISSYELIQRSKFVMIYNSTIGLEAAILGAAVLCGGKARFTRYPIVYFPQSKETFVEQAEAFLAADTIQVPEAFQRNARRFLYYQLFRTSLPFGEYLAPSYFPSFTRLKDFPLEMLFPENARTIKTILDGLLNNGDFLLP